jgi:hypothetical protein
MLLLGPCTLPRIDLATAGPMALSGAATSHTIGHQQSPGEGSLMAGCHDESHSLHNNAEARQ